MAVFGAKFADPCKKALQYSLEHFLHDQAVFFAERLAVAFSDSDEVLHLLAVAHLRSGDADRARTILQARRSSNPSLRYLLAVSCLRLGCPEEAEAALLGLQEAARAEGLRPSDVAGGAAGLFLLGQAKEVLQCREQAVECYEKCLELCPFMWCAYERLSRLVLGTPSSPSSPQTFAGTFFSEEKLAKDTVLHPEFSSSNSTAPPRPRLGIAATTSVAEAAATTASSLVRKRRRDDSGPPLKADAARTPASACNSPSVRVPLADRSVASTPMRLASAAPLQSPEPSAPTVLTPVQFLACLSPRRLLSSPLVVQGRSPLLPLGSAPSPERCAEPVDFGSRRLASAGTRRSSHGTGFCRGRASVARPGPAAAKDIQQESPEDMTFATLLQKLGTAVHAMHSFACLQALSELRTVPAREQGSAFVQGLIARCHFEMAEYAKSAEVYARSCDKHKFHRLVNLEYYSSALWHLRESTELGSLAQRALNWDRLQPQVWVTVGNCFSQQGEHDQAIRCFRRALQLDPSFTYAYTLTAHEYAATEKFDKAIQMYERALGIDSRHYNAWWGLGNVYYRQEEYDNAKYHFQRAVDINGGNAVLRASLGMAWQSLGEPKLALELFSVAAGSTHCSALTAFQKGCVLSTLDRHSEAVEELRQAQRLAPREPCVHFHLGRAYAGCGDARRALFHYTMALDLCGARDSKGHQIIMSAQAELLHASAIGRDGQLTATAASFGHHQPA